MSGTQMFSKFNFIYSKHLKGLLDLQSFGLVEKIFRLLNQRWVAWLIQTFIFIKISEIRSQKISIFFTHPQGLLITMGLMNPDITVIYYLITFQLSQFDFFLKLKKIIWNNRRMICRPSNWLPLDPSSCRRGWFVKSELIMSKFRVGWFPICIQWIPKFKLPETKNNRHLQNHNFSI